MKKFSAMNHPLILLHGWGFSSRIWQPLILALHQQGVENVYAIDLPGFGSAFHDPCESLEQVIEFIVGQLPEKCFLGGWSLGGMLALQVAAREPARIAGVVTVGSNLHFTQDDDWPGMPCADYEQFCVRFAAQPEKTWQRFLGLQTRGDRDEDGAADALQALADYAALHVPTATAMLQLLGTIDNRALLPDLNVPGLHLLGAGDVITPAAVATGLACNPLQQVQLIDGASHAFPVSHAQQVAQSVATFMGASKQSPDKRKVAASFSRAATRYDSAARLQQSVGAALLATLPDHLAGTVVDLGCGTGFITGQLLQKNPAAEIIAVDIASGMVQRLREQHPTVCCVQADMEQLPLATDSAAWLLSSLALQWAADLASCFRDWRRVLQPGGRLLCSTFLPGTLHELAQCWRAVDNAVHVNSFVAETVLLDAMRSAGFAHVETVRATHTLHYSSLQELAHELKAIGAHNLNEGRPAGLTGRKRWAQLQATYENLRTTRGLPATYEVLYVSAS